MPTAQDQIRNRYFASIALAKAAGRPGEKCFVKATGKNYYFEESGAALTANDVDILTTGVGGNTRWVSYSTSRPHVAAYAFDFTYTGSSGMIMTGNTNQWYLLWAERSVPGFGIDDGVMARKIWIAKGTYTFKVLGISAANRAILDWSLDNVDFVTGQDWYSGGTIYNVMKTDTGIVVASSGLKTLRGSTNGKNGSSSGYQWAVTKMIFMPE